MLKLNVILKEQNIRFLLKTNKDESFESTFGMDP